MVGTNNNFATACDNSAFVWTQNTSVKLVELWEAEPVLWDKNHVGYKSGTLKFDALKRIADEFETTPNVVQSKLSNIRSQLSREQKKLKKTTGSGAAEKPRTTWFLFHYLTFLTGLTRIGKTSTSTSSNEAVIEEDLPSELRDEASEDDTDDYTGSEESPRGQYSTLRKRRAENAALTNAVVALSKSLTQPEKPEVEDDECDIFGKLIAKRMRRIKTSVIRMSAEQEILNVITNKICEDEGVILTTTSRVVGNKS